MKKRDLITGILGLAVSGLVIIACESNIPISLEDSLGDIPNVQLKEGATNVNLKVNRDNDRSYFRVELDNLLPESSMRNGQYNAWCVLYNTPIDSDGGEYSGIKLHTIENDPAMQRVSYIINNKANYMKELGADYKDIQVAIWSVLDFPRFDYNTDISRLPSEFRRSGAPAFNTENVDRIVSEATLNQVNDVNGPCFVYLVETPRGEQNVIIEDCETAMARMVNDPDDRTFKFDDHAWFTYVSFPREAGDTSPEAGDPVCRAEFETYFMYAGQHHFAGLFCARRNGDNTITFYFDFLDTEYNGFETHVHIVSNVNDFPSPVPWAFGQYNYKDSFADPVTETDEFTTTTQYTGTVLIAAHAAGFFE